MGSAGNAPAAARLMDANAALILAGAIAVLAIPVALGASTKERASARETSAAAPAKASSIQVCGPPSWHPHRKDQHARQPCIAGHDRHYRCVPPVAGEENGIAPIGIGVLLAIRAAASITSRLLLPVMLSRWSRTGLITASLAGAGITLAILPWVFGNPVLAAVLLAIVGFFLGLGQPITMTLITQAVPPDARGAALALRLLGNRLGQVALPIGAGLLAAPAGPAALSGCPQQFSAPRRYGGQEGPEPRSRL